MDRSFNEFVEHEVTDETVYEEEKSCGAKVYDYTIATVTCPCWCPLWFCFGLVNEHSPIGCLPKCCDYLCYPCEYFWPSNTPMDQNEIRRSI